MNIVKRFYGGLTRVPRSQILSIFEQPERFGSQLSQYKGCNILLVNTASKCGFARQFDGLEALHQRYAGNGLVVIGAPSDDFLHQEPGSDQEIVNTCRLNFGVTFPLLPKGPVRGGTKQGLFKYLTECGPVDLSGEVRWNFEKFLIDREGRLIGRWRSYVSPTGRSISSAISKQLGSCE